MKCEKCGKKYGIMQSIKRERQRRAIQFEYKRREAKKNLKEFLTYSHQ